MRNYEDIESRMDEIDEMDGETFVEEKIVMDEMAAEFESQLEDVRSKVKDV